MRMVGAAVLMWALGACAPPERHPGAIHAEPEAPRRVAPPRFTRELPPLNGVDALPLSVRADELEDPPSWLGPPETVLPPLWADVRSANLDMSRGEALEERLDELPNDNQGVAVLTIEEMFGSKEEDYEDALCEPLRVTWSYASDDGGIGDAAVWFTPFKNLTTTPEPYLAVLTSSCRRALDGTTMPEDAVALGECTDGDEQTFFRDGSDCRDCLEEGGSISACEDAGSCAEADQAAFTWYGTGGGQSVTVEVSTAYIYSCAPNWSALFYMLSKYDEEPGLPDAFENEAWIGHCFAYTDEEQGIVTECAGESLEPGSDEYSLGEGVLMRVDSIADDEEVRGYWDRPAFARSVAFTSGYTSRWFWAYEFDSKFSNPTEIGGLGLRPTDLRPDGADPEEPDDTYARDYVAAVTIATSSNRADGLYVWENHNRCEEGAWQGPDERGRYRCTRMNAASPDWTDDGIVYGGEGLTYAVPLRTLASTGLPDPDVPGGVAIHLACSPSYEQIEGWTCPHTFEPDVVPYDDIRWSPAMVDNSTGTGALEGEGYRFGKDPAWDIRIVAGSDMQLAHRPYDAEGGHP